MSGCRSCSRRLFHSVGPAVAKHQSPKFDLHESFARGVSVDQEELITVWQSPASVSGPGNSSKDSSTLQDLHLFRCLAHISGKTDRIFNILLLDVISRFVFFRLFAILLIMEWSPEMKLKFEILRRHPPCFSNEKLGWFCRISCIKILVWVSRTRNLDRLPSA